jgi:hypothetical protein
MNRNLLVTLLTKNIEELRLITEGFEDSTVYSAAIIQLAKRKTEDIQLILDELGKGNSESKADVKVVHEIEIVQEPLKNDQSLPDEVIVPVEDESKIEIDLNSLESYAEIIKQEVIETTETIILAENVDIELNTVNVDEPEQNENVLEHTVVVEEITKVEETKKITIAEKMSQHSSSRNDALSQKDKSLSATLANKKIEDIKQAISIGDRFRFQRELFKSNGEEMNKTLTYINQLATFNEAVAFLRSKYNWSDDLEAVSDFMQIVHRKFV